MSTAGGSRMLGGRLVERWVVGRLPSALPWCALAVALVFLGGVSAGLWQRYEQWFGALPPDGATAAPATPAVASDRHYRIEEIVATHLFGTAEKRTAATTVAAPTTQLRLVLFGVVASDNPAHARALIGHNAAPARSYEINQQIQGTDATLHSIEAARVLLERNGQLESLALPKPNFADRKGSAALPAPAPAATAQALPAATSRQSAAGSRSVLLGRGPRPAVGD